MEGSNFIIDLIAGLQEKLSMAKLNGDIKSIQNKINKLELQAEINPKSLENLQKRIETIKVKAELDPNAVQNITRQLERLSSQKIIVSNIQLDTGNAIKSGEQLGKNLGNSINKNLTSSLNSVKQNISSIIKGFSSQKLNSYDLSKMFNLNRVDMDSTVTKQVRSLTNELNALAKEALRTNSDSSWDGIINKVSSLSNVLMQFGRSRDLEGFREQLELLDYFQGKKIFVGSKDDALLNTGKSVRELNNEFRNLGVTFTSVAKGATQLDTAWLELLNINQGLGKFTTYGDQLGELVRQLSIAKEAMYGTGNLQPTNKNEVSNVLLGWMSNLEGLSQKLGVLRNEQAEIEQRMAQASTVSANTVTQNEQKKQDAYKQTADALKTVNAEQKRQESLRNLALEFTKTASGKLSSAIDKYSYGNTVDATALMKKMNRGLSNFGDLSNVEGQITSYKAQVESVIESLKRSHTESLNALNQEIQLEQKMQSQKDAFNRRNLNGIDMEIQKREEEARQFSSMLKAQMEAEAKMQGWRTNTLPQIQDNMSNGLYADQVQNQIEKYNRLGIELPNVKARIDELKAAEQELNAVMGSENATIEEQKTAYEKFQSTLRNANTSNSLASSMYMTQDAVDGLVMRLQTFLRNNTAMTGTAKAEINEWIAKLQQTDTVYKSLGNNAVSALKRIEAEQGKIGKLGDSMFTSLKKSFSFLSYWTSSAFLTMQAVTKIRQAFSELKEVNSIMTEISKVSETTAEGLKELEHSSFETASKYGRTASDYLKGVQEMNRAGFQGEAGENMAELSVLAQAAGDLDADLANDYLIASDAAYGYAGNIERLTALLDSQNMVTNKNAVSMEELAKATKVAANQLSNANISENEMTALLGTGIATSREAGETVGRAVKGIVMNLQQVEGETGFDGEIIDEEQLRKVEARCHSVGVELEYMKDGIARLRDPMEVFKELAEVYNSLPDDSADKAGIIADIGGKYRGNVLSSILSNWDKYEKMLSDYASGSGSAMNEAMKSANNWEGSLNRLHNTWISTIENMADSDAIIAIINGTNSLLDVLNKLTSKLGSLGSIGLGAFALINKGRSKQRFCPSWQ